MKMEDQQQLARLLLTELNLTDADFSEATIKQIDELFNHMSDWRSFITTRFSHLVALTGEAILRKWEGTWEQDPSEKYPHLLIAGKTYDFKEFIEDPDAFKPNLLGPGIMYDLTYMSVDMDMRFDDLKGREQLYDYDLLLHWYRWDGTREEYVQRINNTIQFLADSHPSFQPFLSATYSIEYKKIGGQSVRLYTNDDIAFSNSLSVFFEAKNMKFTESVSLTISPVYTDLNTEEAVNKLCAGLVRIWEPEGVYIHYKKETIFSERYDKKG